MNPGDSYLRTLIQALPTKDDIEELFHRLEELQQQALQAVHTEVHQIVEWVFTRESSIIALEARISQLEAVQTLQMTHVSTLQLHLEENCIRHNNLWLRDLPETVPEHLQDTVLAIFNRLLD